MAKRFTDPKKWRNEWFRTLPLEARLVWIYLCDECENTGIMKMDYGLASFQLGFPVSPEILKGWFDTKIHFINRENILIVQFFNFQYGESKDSWSAKVEAKRKLEVLGFVVENDKVQIKQYASIDHCAPTVGDCVPTSLIRSRSISRVISKSKSSTGPIQFESENEMIRALPEETMKRWSELYPDQQFVVREIKKAWGYYHTEKQKPEPKTIRGWCQAISTWLDRGWSGYVRGLAPAGSSKSAAFSNDLGMWMDEAEIFIKAVQNFGAGDHRLREHLGEIRMNWWITIGRSRIANMKLDDFGRRDLAKLIRSVAMNSKEEPNPKEIEHETGLSNSHHGDGMGRGA